MPHNLKLSPLSGVMALSAVTLMGCAAPQPHSQTQKQAQASEQNRHYQDAPQGYADSEVKPNTHRVVRHNTQRYYQFDANGNPIAAPADRYAVPGYGQLAQANNSARNQKTYYQRGIKYNASHPLAKSQNAPTYHRAASLQTSAYRVQMGDTVYRLAKTYCSSVSDIARANGLKLDYAIQADQYLIIPKTQC